MQALLKIFFLFKLLLREMSQDKDKKLTEEEVKAIKAKKQKFVKNQQIINK